MRAAVLFSGGKDSSLSALLVSPHFDITLVTVTFGVEENWRTARRVAEKLGYPHEVIEMEESVLGEITEIMLQDGNTRRGFNELHKRVIERVSEEFSVIVDGVRRDDIAPKLTIDEIRSIESRRGIHYVSPLMGFSRKTVNLLVDKYFEIEEGKDLYVSDYEFELRRYMRGRGIDPLSLFPENHIQSIVKERKDRYGEENARKKIETCKGI
ncbi:MAG: tRNA methyltransferase [Archaeoglobi archaeon]|nr:tRNA methyltransferase [Archaeoglobi archaeon]